MNNAPRFDSLQPNDGAGAIKINAGGDRASAVNSIFLQNKLFGQGCSKHEKVQLDSELPSWMLSN